MFSGKCVFCNSPKNSWLRIFFQFCLFPKCRAKTAFRVNHLNEHRHRPPPWWSNTIGSYYKEDEAIWANADPEEKTSITINLVPSPNKPQCTSGHCSMCVVRARREIEQMSPKLTGQMLCRPLKKHPMVAFQKTILICCLIGADAPTQLCLKKLGYALKKTKRYYLGIFPKRRTNPPPHPPLLGTPYPKATTLSILEWWLNVEIDKISLPPHL